MINSIAIKVIFETNIKFVLCNLMNLLTMYQSLRLYCTKVDDTLDQFKEDYLKNYFAKCMDSLYKESTQKILLPKVGVF